MPPALHLATHYVANDARPSQYSTVMREQWQNPSDILSILMVIGGDIVQRAVAQLAGTGPGPFTPVAFSFGWLAYSITTLTSGVGDKRLLPPPDCSSIFVNAHNGYQRPNQSWVLGRLLRDEEHRLEREHQRQSGDRRHHIQGRGLTIAFYKTSARGETGVPTKDVVYWAGVGIIIVQLVVATIPLFLHGNWVVLAVTSTGTILGLLGSALPQWRREKYAGRHLDKPRLSCLTRGNGAPVVMVFDLTRGLSLEDLAAAKNEPCRFTFVATIALCISWILLVLTVEGLDGDAWYVLAIGAIGMGQNIYAAGARRSPCALGFPLEETHVVNEPKVMDALKEAEKHRSGSGRAVLRIFFPGALRPDEQEWWDKRENNDVGKETIFSTAGTTANMLKDKAISDSYSNPDSSSLEGGCMSDKHSASSESEAAVSELSPHMHNTDLAASQDTEASP